MTVGFKRWLAARPVNARAFELATEVWEESAQLRRVIPFVAETPKPPRRPSRSFIALAAASLAAIAATLGLWLFGGASISTGVGEQRSIALQDGTRIFLNTATRLTVKYDSAVRRVELEDGEALFEVAKRKDWPFVVEAGERHIRALGTSFLVRKDPDVLAVTLVEGRVTVSAPRPSDDRAKPALSLAPASGSRSLPAREYMSTARLWTRWSPGAAAKWFWTIRRYARRSAK